MGQSRTENILENILGAEHTLEPPQSRVEALLVELGEKIDEGPDMDEIEELIEEEVSEQMAALEALVGTPLIASSVSDMTDTNKIYVYVGSETGYTNGDWYYYNGSSWISGGVYNSTALETDTTLSIAGKAADAKATGDAVDDLKSGLNDVIDITGVNINMSLASMGFTDGRGIKYANGQSGASAIRSYSGYIPVGNAETIEITMLKFTASTIFGLAFFTEQDQSTYIESTGVRENYTATADGYEKRTITVPTGAKYFRTTWFASDNTDYNQFSCKLFKAGYIDGQLELINGEIALTNGRILAVENKFIVTDKITMDVEQISGSYAAYTGGGSNNGKVISNENYAYAVVDVVPNTKYYITAYLTGYLGVCFYNGEPSHDNLVSGFNESTAGNYLDDYVAICPPNATKMAVSTAPNVRLITVKYGVDSQLDLSNLYNDVEQIKGVVITVGIGKDYATLTQCLEAIKGNTGEKEIHIYGGEYDILQEIGGIEYINNLPSGSTWRTANKLIPPNTHIIGHGNVIIKMELPSTLDSAVANLFSPINMQGSCSLKNLTIKAKNCRYCIHAEGTGLAAYNNSVWTFEDCYIEKIANEIVGVYQHAIGMGINDGNFVEFKNCVVKSAGVAMGMHDNGYKFAESPVLSFSDSAFVGASTAISFRSTVRNDMAMVIKAMFANCSIVGSVEKTTATAGEVASDIYAVTYIKTSHTNSNTQYIANVIDDVNYN